MLLYFDFVRRPRLPSAPVVIGTPFIPISIAFHMSSQPKFFHL